MSARPAAGWPGPAASPSGLPVEVEDGDGLLAAALGQLDDGADLVKLYMDGPDRDTSPFTAGEVRRTVEAVHARGATVTAHSSLLPGARAAVAAGVDALEHGFQLDADVARAMAAQGTALVATLAVMESWASFAATTQLPRFASAEGRAALAERREAAHESVRLAVCGRGADRRGHPNSAAARCAPTSSPWRSRRWSPPACIPTTPSPRRPSTAGACWVSPKPGVLAQGGPADFLLVHGDPLVRAWVAMASVVRTSW